MLRKTSNKREGGLSAATGVSLLFMSLLVGSFGCAKKYKASLTEIEYQRALAGRKVVPETSLIVNGEEISVEDTLKTRLADRPGRPELGAVLSPVARANSQSKFVDTVRPVVKPIVENQVNEVILYETAKAGMKSDKLEDALAKAEDQEWRSLVIKFDGDEAKADAALREAGMTRKEFKASKRRQILTQVHVQAQTASKRPITHWELVDYYDRLKDERFVLSPRMQFKLIDIAPERLEDVDASLGPLGAARQLADDLLRQLRAGADFEGLARTYSHGLYQAQGGQWPDRSPDSFVAPYDKVVAAARQAAPGDIVGPVEAGGRVFLLKLDWRQERGYRPLSDVQGEVEEAIRKDRYQQAVEELGKRIDALRNVGPTQEYIDRFMKEVYRRSNEE